MSKKRYRNYTEYVESVTAPNALWQDYEYEHLAALDEILGEYPELRDMEDVLNGAHLPAHNLDK